MLNILGSSYSTAPEIEFGPYLPFRLRFPSDVGRPYLYWRTGNFTDRLLELQIDIEDGRAVAVSLILPGKVVYGLPELRLPARVIEGVPVLSTSGWPGNRLIDDATDFNVFVDERGLLIQFDNSEAALRMACARVSFGLDEAFRLLWILVATEGAMKLLEVE